MKLNKWEELSDYYFMLAAFENQECDCFCRCSLAIFNIYPKSPNYDIINIDEEVFPNVYPLLFSKRTRTYHIYWFDIPEALDTNRINLLKECIYEFESKLFK